VRLLQKFLKKNNSSPGIVALSFFPNGFAVAITSYADPKRPQLLHCEFILGKPEQFESQLGLLLKEHELANYDCHILLTHEQYRLMSIEAPAVSSEELKQAIQWRIADVLDYPVEQAIIDYYPLPKSNRANSTKLLEVVASAQQTVTSLSQQCQQAGFKVKVIDIQETALRNLATLLPESDQGIALLHLRQEGGCIVIQKQGELYMSRKISCGYLRLDENAPYVKDEMLRFELDSLALEIQRSFDYVENYFDIIPITSLASILMPVDSSKVVNFLNSSYGITARALDLSVIIESNIVLDDITQNMCAPVIGASLRRLMEVS
jgi:MSHA biogenesis protein MshI